MATIGIRIPPAHFTSSTPCSFFAGLSTDCSWGSASSSSPASAFTALLERCSAQMSWAERPKASLAATSAEWRKSRRTSLTSQQVTGKNSAGFLAGPRVTSPHPTGRRAVAASDLRRPGSPSLRAASAREQRTGDEVSLNQTSPHGPTLPATMTPCLMR